MCERKYRNKEKPVKDGEVQKIILHISANGPF